MKEKWRFSDPDSFPCGIHKPNRLTQNLAAQTDIKGNNQITDVANIGVGHGQDYDAITGVTCVYFPNGAVGGVDVRSGGPGTRETDALQPGRLLRGEGPSCQP